MQKDWLKGHKYAQRPRGDALHARRIEGMLNQGEQLYKEIKQAESFFSTTSRVGAGGTTAGSFGLRFIDRKTNARLHERYTETGKTAKKSQKTMAIDLRNPEYIGDKAPAGPRIRICTLPSNYCPDCDTAINGGFQPYSVNDFRRGTMVTYEPVLNFSPVIEAWPAVQMRPGDVIRHMICGPCVYNSKKPDTSGLKVIIQTPFGPEEVPKKTFDEAQRWERVTENIERFLRHAWTIQKAGTFINEYGEDMSKQ